MSETITVQAHEVRCGDRIKGKLVVSQGTSSGKSWWLLKGNKNASKAVPDDTEVEVER